MSENDEAGGKDVPEFVAVTPRGANPEPTEDEVAETEPTEPEPTEPEVAQPAEPAGTAPETAADAPAEPEQTDVPAEASPSAPVLEGAAPAVTPAGPEAKLALPEPAAEGGVEVSVRAAAEGMAAALAGEAPTDIAEESAQNRSVGPLAVLIAVCVVLVLAAGALLAVTARSNSHHHAISAARVAALEAAKRETAVALTYDYRTLDADFQRAEAGMSRKFRANYAQTAARSVAPLAVKTHAITTGTVAAAGVVSATPDSARVLVFADQTVENKLLNATSRLDRSVIEVTMVKENGRWVIDNLQPF